MSTPSIPPKSTWTKLFTRKTPQERKVIDDAKALVATWKTRAQRDGPTSDAQAEYLLAKARLVVLR